jgi:hypothetical protein
MMRFSLLFLAWLAACEGAPVYEPVEVSVPVSVPCEAPMVPKPAWKLQNTSLDAPFFETVKATLIELDQRKAYEARLEAAIKACE